MGSIGFQKQFPTLHAGTNFFVRLLIGMSVEYLFIVALARDYLARFLAALDNSLTVGLHRKV